MGTGLSGRGAGLRGQLNLRGIGSEVVMAAFRDMEEGKSWVRCHIPCIYFHKYNRSHVINTMCVISSLQCVIPHIHIRRL